MKRVTLSFERDFPILLHLWKFKVGTTHGLWKFLNKGSTLHAFYKRLNRLEKAKFIECNYSKSGNLAIWQLAANGYDCIDHHLPDKLSGDGARPPDAYPNSNSKL